MTQKEIKEFVNAGKGKCKSYIEFELNHYFIQKFLIILYINISDEEWYRRLENRNKNIMENKSDAYYVDEGLSKANLIQYDKTMSYN